MPAFVASVVVEQRGEEWNEQQVADRAKAFKQLTMDKVWEVFFCTSALSFRLIRILANYSKEANPPEKVILPTYFTQLRNQEYAEILKKLSE